MKVSVSASEFHAALKFAKRASDPDSSDIFGMILLDTNQKCLRVYGLGGGYHLHVIKINCRGEIGRIGISYETVMEILEKFNLQDEIIIDITTPSTQYPNALQGVVKQGENKIYFTPYIGPVPDIDQVMIRDVSGKVVFNVSSLKRAIKQYMVPFNNNIMYMYTARSLYKKAYGGDNIILRTQLKNEVYDITLEGHGWAVTAKIEAEGDPDMALAVDPRQILQALYGIERDLKCKTASLRWLGEKGAFIIKPETMDESNLIWAYALIMPLNPYLWEN